MRQLWIALRLTVIEQAHNRFAILLLAVYLPAWYGVSGTTGSPISIESSRM